MNNEETALLSVLDLVEAINSQKVYDLSMDSLALLFLAVTEHEAESLYPLENLMAEKTPGLQSFDLVTEDREHHYFSGFLVKPSLVRLVKLGSEEEAVLVSLFGEPSGLSAIAQMEQKHKEQLRNLKEGLIFVSSQLEKI